MYNPGHKLFHPSDSPNHTWLFIMMLVVLLVQNHFRKLLLKIGKHYKVFKNLEDVDEDWNIVSNFDEKLG